MARPIEFDREDALEAAMKVFWRQGYVATSLSQLLDEMSLGRSSFYAAFGDKRSLFIEALELFSSRTREMLVDAWDETESLDVVRQFFLDTLIDVPRPRASHGCMMVNTVIELADVDEALCDLAARELARVESLFETYFAHAQNAGEFEPDRKAADLAAHVMLLNQGLRVASRKRISRTKLKERVDTALSLLGLPEAG